MDDIGQRLSDLHLHHCKQHTMFLVATLGIYFSSFGRSQISPIADKERRCLFDSAESVCEDWQAPTVDMQVQVCQMFETIKSLYFC